MRYAKSVNQLLSFGIPEITRLLRRDGYTLHKIDQKFKDSPDNYLTIPFVWTITNRITGDRTENKAKVYVRKDSRGLYLEISYSLQRRGEEKYTSHKTRYDLARVESNLKPGTYRYYIKDHYASIDRLGWGLCTRLYFLPEIGEFVPRTILSSWGVLYSQQRKGHKERYLSPSWETPDTRYRKSHYRGRMTPFWGRYEYIRDELDYRWTIGAVLEGSTIGLLPPGVQRELLQDYMEKTGRKTLPSPYSVYRTRR